MPLSDFSSKLVTSRIHRTRIRTFLYTYMQSVIASVVLLCVVLDLQFPCVPGTSVQVPEELYPPPRGMLYTDAVSRRCVVDVRRKRPISCEHRQQE